MRVLLTSAFVRSGVLTHLSDLTNQLRSFGILPSVAFLQVRRRATADPRALLLSARIQGDTACCLYRTRSEFLDFARKQKVELIHAHSSPTFGAALEASQDLGIPLVLTLHGVREWSRYCPRSLDHASRIIAVGPAQARSMGPEYATKTSVIQNGVDLERFRPPPRIRGLEGPLRVLWFGRTSHALSRGVEALDRAVRALLSAGESVDGRVVGSARGASVRTLKVRGWARDPVPALQWGHVVFGHGRSLREGMACGNAGFLLAHGYGGPVRLESFKDREYVPSAIRQYGLPAPDPKAIASDLAPLCRNRSLLKVVRREAREIAERFFDVRCMVEAVAGVYQDSLGRD